MGELESTKVLGSHCLLLLGRVLYLGHLFSFTDVPGTAVVLGGFRSLLWPSLVSTNTCLNLGFAYSLDASSCTCLLLSLYSKVELEQESLFYLLMLVGVSLGILKSPGIDHHLGAFLMTWGRNPNETCISLWSLCSCRKVFMEKEDGSVVQLVVGVLSREICYWVWVSVICSVSDSTVAVRWVWLGKRSQPRMLRDLLW